MRARRGVLGVREFAKERLSCHRRLTDSWVCALWLREARPFFVSGSHLIGVLILAHQPQLRCALLCFRWPRKDVERRETWQRRAESRNTIKCR